jgi:DNA-binding HxlR family transcriptional regulator
MLAQTLRTLTRDGLLIRTVAPTMPPQVTYALSPLGREIMPALHTIRSWLACRVADVLTAQRAFDEPRAAST